jgi:hypothetical protein
MKNFTFWTLHPTLSVRSNQEGWIWREIQYAKAKVRNACNILVRKTEKGTDSIFLIPFLAPLEHGASMKLPVSLQFLNLGQSVGLLGRVISSSHDLYLHKTTQT